uniref:Ig-like domain-containing protein n=1 Tax=Equus asinus TaxID=9793 RepID=A0A8C4LML5_EQUAS
MGTRLLCCLMLCLLGAGHTDTGVSQSPRHRVTQYGEDVAFRCDPISEHTRLYWYRQTSGQNMEFLTYFQNDFASDTSGMPSDQFSAERPKGSYSTLKIQRAEQRDSAVYLCASS